MFAKYTIPVNNINFVTGRTINIPINMEYQIVDNSELIEKLFVEVETQKSVNPILDYEKVRFIPVDNSNAEVENIVYNLYFLNQNNSMQQPTYYSDIEFDDSDIRFFRNNFTDSYVLLSFYDTDNALTQNLVSELVIYNRLTPTDYYPIGSANPGRPKPASQIPISLLLTNPITQKNGFHEGYYLYNYKDEYVVANPPKYLYMKATYFNAKTGKFINLTTEPSPYKIDELVKKIYTRYELFRNTTGFYYTISNTFSQNVSYNQNLTNLNKKDVIVKLYQIQAL